MSKQNILLQAIEILETPPIQRSEMQLTFLQQETSQIGLFKSYKEEDGDNQLHRLCCLYMKHEFFHKDEAVFNIDEIGSKFYIIISGKVGVFIRMPKHKRQEMIIEGNGQMQNQEDVLTMVKELRTSDSFGELALLKNSKRLASIICLEDCHFGVIDKKIFNLALKEKEEEKLNVQMRFLANNPLFSRLPKSTIKVLHMNSFQVQYQKGQQVFEEGQHPNSCFVIKSGEFTIFKKVDDFFKEYEKRNQYYSVCEVSKQIELKIMVLARGELFGETEIITDELRKTSAVCTSLEGGELIIINRVDLESRVLNEQDRKQKFENYVKQKNGYIKQRIQGTLNQLLKYQQFRYKTGAQKREQEDLCEQIKNKDTLFNKNTIDELLSSYGQLEVEEEVGFYKQKKLLNFKSNQETIKSITNSGKEQEAKNNKEIQLLNQKAHLSPGQQDKQQLNLQSQSKVQQSQQINKISEKGEEEQEQDPQKHWKHISKEQNVLQKFSNQEKEKSVEIDQDQKKKSITKRIELKSYTNLKNNIRKKTAIALSKQYRSSFEQFMKVGASYEISQSQQQHQQQIINSQQEQEFQKMYEQQRTNMRTAPSLGKRSCVISVKASPNLHVKTPTQSNSQTNIQKNPNTSINIGSRKLSDKIPTSESQIESFSHLQLTTDNHLLQDSSYKCLTSNNQSRISMTQPVSPKPIHHLYKQEIVPNFKKSKKNNSNIMSLEHLENFESQPNVSHQHNLEYPQQIQEEEGSIFKFKRVGCNPSSEKLKEFLQIRVQPPTLLEHALKKENVGCSPLQPSQNSIIPNTTLPSSPKSALPTNSDKRKLISLNNAFFLFNKSPKQIQNKNYSRLHYFNTSTRLQAHQLSSSLSGVSLITSNKKFQEEHNGDLNISEQQNDQSVQPIIIQQKEIHSKNNQSEIIFSSKSQNANKSCSSLKIDSSLKKFFKEMEDRNVHYKFYQKSKSRKDSEDNSSNHSRAIKSQNGRLHPFLEDSKTIGNPLMNEGQAGRPQSETTISYQFSQTLKSNFQPLSPSVNSRGIFSSKSSRRQLESNSNYNNLKKFVPIKSNSFLNDIKDSFIVKGNAGTTVHPSAQDFHQRLIHTSESSKRSHSLDKILNPNSLSAKGIQVKFSPNMPPHLQKSAVLRRRNTMISEDQNLICSNHSKKNSENQIMATGQINGSSCSFFLKTNQQFE